MGLDANYAFSIFMADVTASRTYDKGVHIGQRFTCQALKSPLVAFRLTGGAIFRVLRHPVYDRRYRECKHPVVVNRKEGPRVAAGNRPGRYGSITSANVSMLGSTVVSDSSTPYPIILTYATIQQAGSSTKPLS